MYLSSSARPVKSCAASTGMVAERQVAIAAGSFAAELLVPLSEVPVSFNDPMDRDRLLLPEVLLEDYRVDLSGALKPAFDSVWMAAGWPRSANYDAEGRRTW